MRETTQQSHRRVPGSHDLHAPVTAADHRRGASRPRITVVEYGDFASAACRAAEPAVRLLLASNPETVELVFRHFPMEAANPLALMAAEATEAAAAQGMFWQMHDALLQEGASLRRASLDGAALALGLDVAQFKASLDEGIYLQRVREHQAGGVRSHLRASPEFFVGGKVCDVSFGLENLESAVRFALANR
jgi:protein-disulfide isomerase